jgi:hypothetical protein
MEICAVILRAAALLAVVPAQVLAQGLSLMHAEDGTLDMLAPRSGQVELVFHYPASENERRFHVDLSTFASAGGDVAAVGWPAPEQAEPTKVTTLVFPADSYRAVLSLAIGELLPGEVYEGRLSASTADETASWTLQVRKPDPLSELVTDVDRVEVDVVKGRGARFALTLREKSGGVPVQSLSVRRALGTESKGELDLAQHLKFRLDGSEVDLLTSTSDGTNSQHAHIPPDTQRLLEVEVAGLPVGEHQVTLQLDTSNARAGTEPKLLLVVNVRHSILLAILTLLAALLLSFVITKGLVNWRARLTLRRSARLLKRDWLKTLPPLMPVVWLQSTRRQAEMVLDKFSFLPAPEELSARLDNAARLLERLRRYRDLAAAVERQHYPYMIDWRMRPLLDEILLDIEPELLDEAAANSLDAKFDQFESWMTDPLPAYRPKVAAARAKTLNMVSSGAITVSGGSRDKLGKLWNEYVVNDLESEATLDHLLKVDRVRAAFRVLWRHRNEPDLLKQMVELVAQDVPEDIDIKRVFALSNSAKADEILEEFEAGRAFIKPSEEKPVSSAVTALAPTRFSILLPDNPELEDGYLLKFRAIADWHFRYVPPMEQPVQAPGTTESEDAMSDDEPPQEAPTGGSALGIARPRPLSGKRVSMREWERRCSGRSVIQFAPDAGRLEVRVRLRHRDTVTPEIRGVVEVEKYDSPLMTRLVATEEYVLNAVSFGLALASGLVLYYFPNPTFGSLQDYLALFTWGIGIDQGKNLVQTFRDLKQQSVEAAGA